MKRTNEAAWPLARKDGLIVKEIADEVLVYDLDRNKAHCLNLAAAFIWDLCDGKTSIHEIAAQVSSSTGLTEDREVVLLALEQLRKSGLLQAGAPKTDGDVQITRRNLIKKIGVAAVALPLVTSILAPTAAASTSCGGSCFETADCPQTGSCKTCHPTLLKCVAP